MPTFLAYPFRVALGARHQQPEAPSPTAAEDQVLALDGHQLAPAQRRGEAEQQQRAVAQAGGVGAAGGDQPAHLGGAERGRPPEGRASVVR